jgi:hypothetical protein
MIKFFCDSCGRDISERVYDSVRQFCERYPFDPNILSGVTREDPRQLPDADQELENHREPVHCELQLLTELSKLIHACAWGWSTITMRCGHCAVEHDETQKAKVITIFTRISERQMEPDAPNVAFN